MENKQAKGQKKDEEATEVKSFDSISAETSGDYLKSWPVQLPVPLKPIYVKGSRSFVRRKPYRFKYSYMKNWLVPLDGPMSMDHIHFLLECFVVSAGPEPHQLGRYHPTSDPEEFCRKEIPGLSLNSEDDDTVWAKIPVLYNDGQAGPSSSWPDDNEEFTFDNYYPATVNNTRAEPYMAPFDFFSSDDMIVKELLEMKMMLERILDSRELMEWEDSADIRELLAMLPNDTTPKEPMPPFPVGEWEFNECGICFDAQWLYRRACCFFPACSTCLQTYFTQKIEDGQVKIECCNSECDAFVHREEISARLSGADKEKFNHLLVLANQDATTKTCPRCSHVTKIPKKSKQMKDGKFPTVTCPNCRLDWCFTCHAPCHGAVSCKQFQRGDRLLRQWARDKSSGQLNAQKCPKCKIFIQRTAGCDHMHCSRCKTDFCYRCGEKFRYVKFFGDHYSKFSIFGCRYRFKADQPFKRKMIRGAIFGGKIIAAPVIGALALCAGALCVGISIFALPVYGGVRLYRVCEGRQAKVIRRRYPPPTYHIHNVPTVNMHLSQSFP